MKLGLGPVLAIVVVCLAGGSAPAFASTVFIRGGRVIDGTGEPARRADVRLEGDRIVSVAPGLAPKAGERVVDARGKVVAPGFIDLHNHSDRQVFDMPAAATQAAQGITTAVVGVDGGGALPVRDFLARLDAAPAAINIATMVGHGAVRAKVMGDDYKRPARPDEVAAMRDLVAQAMAEGAFGLSSGLEYDPGYYSTTDELVALAEPAARRGGFYASHIRNEADETLRALAEAVEVGWRARIPVHISHIKLGTVGVWGRTAEALRILHDAARDVEVTADWYPYDFWASTTYVLMPGGRDWEDREGWVKGLADVGGASHVLITDFPADHSYDGKTLAAVAAAQRKAPADVLMDIVRRGNADILCTSMSEPDLLAFLRDPLVMVASDGGIEIAHPRGAGTFPRVLGRYVRERKVIPLEAALRKMTGMPARRLGLVDRGLLRPGMKADVVVFDPRTVADRSTAARPQARPAGIEHVFVNGVAVVESGRPTAARPGRALRSLPGNVGHEQALDRPPLQKVRAADLVQVVQPHAGVPDVLGIDGHGDATAAVLQAAGPAHDHAAAEAAVLDHLLQGIEDVLGPLLPAGALGVARGPRVEADEDVALGLGHSRILSEY